VDGAEVDGDDGRNTLGPVQAARNGAGTWLEKLQPEEYPFPTFRAQPWVGAEECRQQIAAVGGLR